MPEPDKSSPCILLTKEPLDKICASDDFPQKCESVSLGDYDVLHVVAWIPDNGLVGQETFWLEKKGAKPARLDKVADRVELIDDSPMKKSARHWHLFELQTKHLEAGGIYELVLKRFQHTWPFTFIVRK